MPALATRTAYPQRSADLADLVPKLVESYPSHDEYDLAALVEVRWHRPITNREFDRLCTLFVRAKLQEYLPEDSYLTED